MQRKEVTKLRLPDGRGVMVYEYPDQRLLFFRKFEAWYGNRIELRAARVIGTVMISPENIKLAETQAYLNTRYMRDLAERDKVLDFIQKPRRRTRKYLETAAV